MEIRKLASKWIKLATFREASSLLIWVAILVSGLFVYKYFTSNDIRDFYFALVFFFLGWYQFERIGFEQIIREKEQRIAELESDQS